MEARLNQAYICAYVRTPIGRYGGALSTMRPDDLAAVPLRALMAACTKMDWEAVDEVVLGCANQAGEDNRNVARMGSLLAGIPVSVAGTTVNRLCGSGMDAILVAARAIRSGEADLVVAGGVESMSRAPFVMPKAETAYSRSLEIYDTTIGWRFINPVMVSRTGVDSMPETAENVADEFGVGREEQDLFALNSQRKAHVAQESGRLAEEITPVMVPSRKGDPTIVSRDEHPRATTMEALTKLKPIVRQSGTVTAGNSSGVNDGAAALIIASEAAAARHGLTPLVRIVGGATAGVPPRIMGIGPVPATRKLLARLGWTLDQLDLFELNEAFASQGLAVLNELGIPADDIRLNRNGGAIALGHPLGMSGARIAGTAALELNKIEGRRAVATMCVGVGQGIAVALERI